jgi:hypothetical protein
LIGVGELSAADGPPDSVLFCDKGGTYPQKTENGRVIDRRVTEAIDKNGTELKKSRPET